MAKDEIELSFYEWSLLEAEVERGADFPLVRRFADDNAGRFWQIINKINPEEQAQFMRALIRYSNREFIALKGDFLSEQDRSWISRYHKYMVPLRQPVLLEMIGAPSVTSRDILKAIRTCSWQSIQLHTVTRYYEIIELTRDVNNLVVHTVIDVGGRSHQVSFDHDLKMKDGRILLRYKDPLRWLGISTAQWVQVKKERIPMILETIELSLNRFDSAIRFMRELGTL
jgi:hypothetical protein